MKVVHTDATRQRHKIMGTFGINKKQLYSRILQAHSAHQRKDLPQSNAFSSPLPWDWRTEERGEVITSEEHIRAVATTPNENVKRQARYKPHPTGHINGGHQGLARSQARQRQTKTEHKSKGGDHHRPPQTKSPLTRGEWAVKETWGQALIPHQMIK